MLNPKILLFKIVFSLVILCFFNDAHSQSIMIKGRVADSLITLRLVKEKALDNTQTDLPTMATSFNTSVTQINIDESKKYQVMEGFGGLGAQDVYCGVKAHLQALILQTIL